MVELLDICHHSTAVITLLLHTLSSYLVVSKLTKFRQGRFPPSHSFVTTRLSLKVDRVAPISQPPSGQDIYCVRNRAEHNRGLSMSFTNLGFGKIYTFDPPGPVFQIHPAPLAGTVRVYYRRLVLLVVLQPCLALLTYIVHTVCSTHRCPPDLPREMALRTLRTLWDPTSHLTLITLSLRILLQLWLQFALDQGPDLSTFLLPTPRWWTPVTSAGEIFLTSARIDSTGLGNSMVPYV